LVRKSSPETRRISLFSNLSRPPFIFFSAGFSIFFMHRCITNVFFFSALSRQTTAYVEANLRWTHPSNYQFPPRLAFVLKGDCYELPPGEARPFFFFMFAAIFQRTISSSSFRAAELLRFSVWFRRKEILVSCQLGPTKSAQLTACPFFSTGKNPLIFSQ